MEQTCSPSVLDCLLKLEATKTWSLIATIFGDLDGERLSGKELGGLLSDLGVKPEATRVALHRLKKDGWIVSEKIGREVIYTLSPFGRQETIAAQKDVYRADVKFAAGWHLLILPLDVRWNEDDPHVVIEKNTLLVPNQATKGPKVALEAALVTPLPDWFEARLVPAHVLKQAEELALFSKQFLSNPSREQEELSVRLLFLHYWRRMALRTGTWAHISLYPDGSMARFHSAMSMIFKRTSRTDAKAVVL